MKKNLRRWGAGIAFAGATAGVICLLMPEDDVNSASPNVNAVSASSPSSSSSSSAPSNVISSWSWAASPFASCGGVGQLACDTSEPPPPLPPPKHDYPEKFTKQVDLKIEDAVAHLKGLKDLSTEERFSTLSLPLQHFLEAKYKITHYAQNNEVEPYQSRVPLPPELKDPNIIVTMYCEALREMLLKLGQDIRLSNDSYERQVLAEKVAHFITVGKVSLSKYLSSNKSADGMTLWFEFKHDFVSNPNNGSPEIRTDFMAQTAGFSNVSEVKTFINNLKFSQKPADEPKP